MMLLLAFDRLTEPEVLLVDQGKVVHRILIEWVAALVATGHRVVVTDAGNVIVSPTDDVSADLLEILADSPGDVAAVLAALTVPNTLH